MVCAFLIIIRSVRNLFKIWMQEAAAGRKIFWRRFFMIVIGKTYNKSKKKGNIQTPHFLL